MKIVVTKDAAYVEENGQNVADICLIGGLAVNLFGSDEGIAAKRADLATRQDAELREQAIAALANDYCPQHLLESRRAMQEAVRARSGNAGHLCDTHFSARWEWAREVAPQLMVERR